MSKLSPARQAALAVFSKRRRRDARIRELLRSDAAVKKLSDKDRALASRLCLGATAAQSLLSERIDELVSKPKSLEPRVRDALIISAFEICYLDTPREVAVSQGVELVRSASSRAAGLANAVLRRIADSLADEVSRARSSCEQGDASDEELVLASGAPVWLMSTIAGERGRAFASGLSLAQLEAPPVFIAANRARLTHEELFALAEAAGLEPNVRFEGCIELGNSRGISAFPSLLADDCVVSDMSAQLVAAIVGSRPVKRALEVGQGRATKSLLLAASCEELVGIDSIESKVELARERLSHAGLSKRCTSLCFDALDLAYDELPAELDRDFDLVFVDAPCSGTGTMRRHPETASRISEDEIDRLGALQYEMLCAAADRVALHGRLVYSTCSVLIEEDEDVVEDFLASYDGEGFKLVSVAGLGIKGEAAALIERCRTSSGYLLTCPSADAGDGHFCAVFERVSG